jgi:predicted DCC family thiol-disulfide oxidoreductase YuxK
MDDGKERKLEKVVVFDGDCAVCSRFVKISVAMMEGTTVGFVASESVLGQKILKYLSLPAQPSGAYFIQTGSVMEKSDAVFELIRCFRCPYRWLWVLKGIPSGIRDWIYNGVARIRRKLGVKKPQSCEYSPMVQEFLITTDNCSWTELEKLFRK